MPNFKFPSHWKVWASEGLIQVSEGPTMASKGPTQASEGPMRASKGPMWVFKGPIQAPEGPIWWGEIDGWTDGRMEILPCVLQDFVPFGSAALLPSV